MQPMNVLPVSVSQDTDLSSKESLDSLGGSNKGAGFSTLIEKHIFDKKEATNQKNSDPKIEKDTATRGSLIAANGKSETHESDNRQESDFSGKSSDNNKKENEITIQSLKINSTENDTDKESQINSDALAESEQFFSLLYNSDNTLAHSTAKDAKNNELALVNQTAETVNKSGVKGGIKTDVDNKQSSIVPHKEMSNVTISEVKAANIHKLQAFSRDELLASMQLRNSGDSTQQSSEQVLKGYQGTDKLVKELNTEVTKIAKDQLKVVVDLGKAQLPVEPIELDKATVDGLSNGVESSALIKESTLPKDSTIQRLVLENNNKGDLAQNLATEEGVEIEGVDSKSVVEKEIIIANATLMANTNMVNKNVQSEKQNDLLNLTNLTSGNANSVKTIVDNTDKKIGSLDVATDYTASDKLKANQNQQKTVSSIGQNQNQNQNQTASLQQTQTQIDNNDLSSADSNENAYIESSLLAQEKPKEQGTNVTNKLAENTLFRSISESQTQGMQANQLRQNNDAYMEHQTSEVLSHNVASDTAQIQKNNVQLQQETISIFKKDFADAVKDKVMVMINQKLQQFDITLDPPEFGNMQVRVNLQGEQASVNFVVQNQQAKEALEQNMHKLKEMLAEQGVDVGGANVEQQDQQSKNDENNLENNQPIQLSGLDEDETVKHELSAKLFDSSATGVDYYA